VTATCSGVPTDAVVLPRAPVASAKALPPKMAVPNLLWPVLLLAVPESGAPPVRAKRQNKLFEFLINALEICYDIGYL
jgi:hypothetical protein